MESIQIAAPSDPIEEDRRKLWKDVFLYVLSRTYDSTKAKAIADGAVAHFDQVFPVT